MKHVRMLGLALCAVFALGALTAAGASAKLPELGECKAVEGGVGGRYLDAACTEKAARKQKVFQGGYEWSSLVTTVANRRRGVTGHITFELADGEKIECASVRSNDHYEFSATGLAKTPTLDLGECTNEGKQCSTASIGSQEETIQNTLARFEEEGRGWEGQFGLIEGKGGPSPVAGLQIAAYNHGWEGEVEGEPFVIPPGTPESVYTPVVCGDPEIETQEEQEKGIGTVLLGGDTERKYAKHNAWIGQIGPVNQMTESLTITYGESAPGIQAPQKFEHGRTAQLQAFHRNRWEPVAVTGELNIAIEPERYVELKASK